jgi:hypothetical protein
MQDIQEEQHADNGGARRADAGPNRMGGANWQDAEREAGNRIIKRHKTPQEWA